MSDIRLTSNEDDDVVRGLRSLYAAPSGDAYWNELESRIMARVADVELGWWTELDRWVRPAISAAAILLVAACCHRPPYRYPPRSGRPYKTIGKRASASCSAANRELPCSAASSKR
jgi:hypothetical protein